MKSTQNLTAVNLHPATFDRTKFIYSQGDSQRSYWFIFRNKKKYDTFYYQPLAKYVSIPTKRDVQCIKEQHESAKSYYLNYTISAQGPTELPILQ